MFSPCQVQLTRLILQPVIIDYNLINRPNITKNHYRYSWDVQRLYVSDNSISVNGKWFCCSSSHRFPMLLFQFLLFLTNMKKRLRSTSLESIFLYISRQLLDGPRRWHRSTEQKSVFFVRIAFTSVMCMFLNAKSAIVFSVSLCFIPPQQFILTKPST